MKLTLKCIKYTLLLLLILVLLLVGILILAVKTETGSRYILSAVPGLTVTEPKGSLSGGWSAKELVWQNESIKITASHPSLDWSINCILKANVCISNLSVNQLDIDLVDSNHDTQQQEKEDQNNKALPTIHLPITIDVDTVSLAKLTINKQEIISQISLTKAHWQGTKVTLESLKTYNNQAKSNAVLSGDIAFKNNWPLNVSGKAELNDLFTTPWQIELHVQGELQKQLTVDIVSTGYLEAKLQGAAYVLEKNLPANLTLSAQDFLPKNISELPDSLLLKKLDLTATGDLVKGFTVKSNAVLAGHTTPVNLTLESLLTTQKAVVQALTLSTSPQHFVTLVGQATFQPTLEAEANIDYQQFPWQELYPLPSTPPIDLQTLQAKASYQNERYQATLDASLTGPAGNFTVTTALAGDFKQLLLETLQINTPDKGNIKGTAQVTFAPTLAWLANLNLQKINPNYWITDLKGSLDGTIKSTGSMTNDQLETDTHIAIQGNLNKQISQIKTHIMAKNQQWDIPELLIKVGSNTIAGQAKLHQAISADLAIHMPNLNQLLPTLKGSLVGKAEVTGTLQKPNGTISLTGNRLSFKQDSIQQLQVSALLNNQQQGNVKLQANRIKSSNILLGNLTLSANGDMTQQQLNLQLSGGIVTLLTAINSQQNNQHNWVIDVNKLNIASQGQNWQLQQTTRLNYSNSGELTIANHCFVNGQATFCAVNQQKLFPNPRIYYRLSNFPLDSLKPWYPENFNWRGILSANIELSLPQQGPTGKIEINADKGIFQLRESSDDNWYDFPYQSLNTVINLTPRNIISTLEFKGNNLGNIQTQISLDPLAKNKPIQGNFKIDGFDISIFRPFIPNISELTGKVDGYGEITGLLEKPYVSGKVMLKNGTVMGDISVSLQNLQATTLIEGESLTINGSWQSGKQGRGKITGNADWHEGINLNVLVQASKLPLIIAPYANLEANTDLTLQMKNNLFNVKGTVDIPTGSIIVRELPPSTVTVSSDVIIVGQEAETDSTPIQLDMDVKIGIGQEKLTFQGFGLTSTITGNLSITKNLFTQGTINLKNGIYRAYGQRLQITRANILFTGSMTEPSLDIEAIRKVDDVTAGVRVTGFTSQPKVTIFSTPAMSQDQALSYIIFGRPVGAGDSNVLAQAALAMGVSSSSETVGEFASKVGIQDFQLDTSGSGDTTSVVASGKINDKLSIHYGVSVFKAANTLMLRYNLTKSIYLEAAGGAASSLDIFYKRSFK